MGHPPAKNLIPPPQLFYQKPSPHLRISAPLSLTRKNNAEMLFSHLRISANLRTVFSPAHPDPRSDL